MHELGIVFAMIDQLEDVAKEQHLAHIQKVTVDLGEVSGIVTDFFEDAAKESEGRKSKPQNSSLA